MPFTIKPISTCVIRVYVESKRNNDIPEDMI